MQKPNVVQHMSLYGSVYGFLLAMLFLWAGIIAGRFGVGDYSFYENLGYSVGIGVLIGAIPGAAIGNIGGRIIRRILGKLKLPIDEFEFKESRKKAFRAAGLGTFVVMSILVLLSCLAFARSPLDIVFFSTPILIGVLASLYTTHGYMAKFRKWIDVMNAKNEDMLENSLSDDDFVDDDYLLTAESDSQVDNLTY